MVSFSCDKCQNVFTKPKVERHFPSCRTRSVSCIDCSVVFDKHSVRKHMSCISEAEKYAPKNKSSTECTQTFCGKCKLTLNGAVHALQHYESKKHRAAERKIKAAEQQKEKESKASPPAPAPETEPAPVAEIVVKKSKSEVTAAEKRKKQKNDKKKKEKKPLGIKKAMKKVLKKVPKQRLKRDGLINAMANLLGKKSPKNLPELIDKKASNSTRFKVRNGRISLISSEQS